MQYKREKKTEQITEILILVYNATIETIGDSLNKQDTRKPVLANYQAKKAKAALIC